MNRECGSSCHPPKPPKPFALPADRESHIASWEAPALAGHNADKGLNRRPDWDNAEGHIPPNTAASGAPVPTGHPPDKDGTPESFRNSGSWFCRSVLTALQTAGFLSCGVPSNPPFSCSVCAKARRPFQKQKTGVYTVLLILFQRLEWNIRIKGSANLERCCVSINPFEDTPCTDGQCLSLCSGYHNNRFFQNHLGTNPHAATAILLSWRCSRRSLIR